MAIAPPKVLKEAGRKFWREVTNKYELRQDELRTLTSACRTLDLIAEVEQDWNDRGRPKMSTGSMGQEVEHPMLATMDKLQKSFELYRKNLALPDEGEAAEAKSNQARAAANTRWAAAHGRSA